MLKNEAIARIRQAEPAIRMLGAEALYLFGSTARDEATPASDVDVFIERDPSRAFGLLEFAELERLLSQTLGTRVDLCTRRSLHPMLREDIEQQAIRVL